MRAWTDPIPAGCCRRLRKSCVAPESPCILATCGEGPEGPESDTTRDVGCDVCGGALGADPIKLRKLAAADVLPPPKKGLLGLGADIGPDALLAMLLRLAMEVRALFDDMAV